MIRPAFIYIRVQRDDLLRALYVIGTREDGAHIDLASFALDQRSHAERFAEVIAAHNGCECKVEP